MKNALAIAERPGMTGVDSGGVPCSPAVYFRLYNAPRDRRHTIAIDIFLFRVGSTTMVFIH